MLSRKDESDVNVTWEDQQMICRFSVLNQFYNDDKSILEMKDTELKQLEASVEDFDEYELTAEEGPIRVSIGDVFLHLPLEMAKTEVNKKIENLKKQIFDLKAKQEARNKELTTLKATLTAKFGNSINLEDDE